MIKEKNTGRKIPIVCLKGSFTIEAAIVLPLIVYVLLLVIYIGFYVYSSYALTLDAYISVFRGSRANLQKENAHQVTEETMKTALQEELPAMGNIAYDIQSDTWKNSITVKGMRKIPFMQSVISRWIPLHISRYAERTEPVFFLRNCRKLKAVLEEG